MDKKEILIVTYDRYPNGNAGAVRQHIFARAFMELGYKVSVIGMGDGTGFCYKNYDGVRYISLREDSNGLINKIRNRIFYKKRLKKYLKSESPSVILVVSITLGATKYLKKYAKKNNIRLIHDSVEWYSKEEFSLGVLDPEYIKKNNLNKHILDKNFNIIAISQYLYSYFSKKGIKCVRIPFVQDLSCIDFEKKLKDDKIVIVYAGAPGKKDRFDNIIEALLMLSVEEREKLELRIIGIDKKGFINKTAIIPEKIDKLSGTITFLGRIKREEVIENLKEADFTILVRPEELRYTKAGFPTKVTESLSYKTPVIANYTSDLELYLKDGVNSMIIKENSAKSIFDTLSKCLKLSKEEIEEMCVNSQKTAREELDYRCFLGSIKEILEN